MSDSVNNPSHYNAGGIETIEGIKAALGDGFSDYCLGNVIKYVWRCKHKGKLLEDLRKAAKYLQWAIEAAESNSPETPDSSSGNSLAIPHGWRELEPDEIPLATDMHEWMGGWIVRTTDSGQPYKWHCSRHIRKIETPKPEPLAIPEGWRELEARETPIASDMYEHEGRWLVRGGDSSVEYEWYDARHIRKIETANPSEAPNSLTWVPKVGDNVRVNCPRRTFDGKVGVIVEGNAGRYAVRLDSENLTATNLEVEHLELIETANPSETPNGSAWIPRVGDKVRVVNKASVFAGKKGSILDVSEEGSFTIYFVSEDEKLFSWVRPEHLELIEAAQ